MVPFNLSKRAVNAYDLAIASGVSTRGRPMSSGYGLGCPKTLAIYRPSVGLGALGFRMPGSTSDILNSGNVGSVLDAVQTGAAFVPGVGQAGAMAFSFLRDAIGQFENWFNIGSGRNEADVIVPKQNELMENLGIVTNQILVSNCPDLTTLFNLYLEVWQLSLGFMEFVLLDGFSDRRASGQALNTVMPYIDGTCGYSVPLGMSANPAQRNCLSWGDGTCGGVGTDGMLGALGRAIEAAGGTVPDLGVMSEQAGEGVDPETIELPYGSRLQPFTQLFSGNAPLILGAVALFFLSGRKKFFKGGA